MKKLISFFLFLFQLIKFSHQTNSNPAKKNEYNLFLLRTLKEADEARVYRLIKKNELSSSFTATAHFSMFYTVLKHFKSQVDAKKLDRNRVKVEGLIGYLKYILKTNFRNRSRLSLSEFYDQNVLNLYRLNLTTTGKMIISLQQANLIDTFFTEMSKDLNASLKIQLLKEILTSTLPDEEHQGHFLLFQSFLRSCPDCVEREEMQFGLNKMKQPVNRFPWLFFLAPLHLILLELVPDLERIDSLLSRTIEVEQDNLIHSNRSHAIAQLGLLMKITKLITKHRIANRTLNRHILKSISRLFFPSMPMHEILLQLIRAKQPEIFEFFFAFSETLTLSIINIGLLVTESLRHVLLQMTTDLRDLRENRSHHFNDDNFDFILIVLAYFPLKTVLLPENAVPEADPQARDVSVLIVNYLIQVTAGVSIPRTRIGMVVPEGADKIIRVREPHPVLLPSHLVDLYYRFPVYYYAARIILLRIFNIPLVATRVPDSANDMAEWREAVHFMNFYLERYASISNLSERYEIVSINR